MTAQLVTDALMMALRSASSNNVKNRKRSKPPASGRSRQEFPIEAEVEREIFNETISEHKLETHLWWAVQEYLFAHKYGLHPVWMTPA